MPGGSRRKGASWDAGAALPGLLGEEPLEPAAHRHVHAHHQRQAQEHGRAGHYEAAGLKQQPGGGHKATARETFLPGSSDSSHAVAAGVWCIPTSN